MIPVNHPKSITNLQADSIIINLDAKERLIFRFAVETGLRIGDILNLRASALAKHIHIVERKTRKFRTVEISDKLLKDLIEFRGCWYDIEPTQYLFKSYRNPLKPYNRMTYHRKLKKVAKRLQIDFSAHSTRKLYAQNIFAETHDIFKVQEALQHKYLETTAIYLDMDLKSLILQILSR